MLMPFVLLLICFLQGVSLVEFFFSFLSLFLTPYQSQSDVHHLSCMLSWMGYIVRTEIATTFRNCMLVVTGQ